MADIDPMLLVILIVLPVLPIGIFYARYLSRRSDQKYGRTDT